MTIIPKLLLNQSKPKKKTHTHTNGLILQYQENKLLRNQIILLSHPLKGCVLNANACLKLPPASLHTNCSNESFKGTTSEHIFIKLEQGTEEVLLKRALVLSFNEKIIAE